MRWSSALRVRNKALRGAAVEQGALYAAAFAGRRKLESAERRTGPECACYGRLSSGEVFDPHPEAAHDPDRLRRLDALAHDALDVVVVCGLRLRPEATA